MTETAFAIKRRLNSKQSRYLRHITAALKMKLAALLLPTVKGPLQNKNRLIGSNVILRFSCTVDAA